MGTLKDHLSRIETRLQTLIEGSAAKLFPGHLSTADLALRLVEAMHAGLRHDADGNDWVPNIYTIHTHPHNAYYFEASPGLIGELTRALDQAGTEAEFLFSGDVIVDVLVDPLISISEIQVRAQSSHDDLPQTTAVELPVLDELVDTPASAFIIVDGTKIYTLNKAAVNIGRRQDNDLVIDDPRVSRLHAQLRWVRGRYMLFDLESAGGTWVNDTKVNQATLRPGDVISLAGVPLVFGLEDAGTDYTQEYVLQD